jgi:hypothetical protein
MRDGNDQVRNAADSATHHDSGGVSTSHAVPRASGFFHPLRSRQCWTNEDSACCSYDSQISSSSPVRFPLFLELGHPLSHLVGGSDSSQAQRTETTTRFLVLFSDSPPYGGSSQA